MEKFKSAEGYQKYAKALLVTRISGPEFARVKGTKGWGYNTFLNRPFMVNVVDDYEMFKDLANVKKGHSAKFVLGDPRKPKPVKETESKKKTTKGDKE